MPTTSLVFFVISLAWIIVRICQHKKPDAFLLLVFILSALMQAAEIMTFLNMPY
ncbi:hypothetical protein [Lentilactobacillus sp. Marseille-Q4993]|uniref:hypothetical protein n=1 Tax=Lentilactobacillus sp. Marseille-Q4993 TaxID=3039492 RepID=UPI0024BD2724|nr:hypothetical protein [Lentilactobacillus sp. Marseille-Q4993]